MNPATLEFLKQRFAHYYQKSPVLSPPCIGQREWGFIFFDPSEDIRMRRHMAFSSRDELSAYIRSMIPRHLFFSTAYYALPSAPTMKEKIWSGADLIFDLDADHIIQKVSYEEMLLRVRDETLKLIDMLTSELGFSKKGISIVFSGGRGYHLHIRDLPVREWKSAERRELVDYVCGIGISPGVMLKGRASGGKGWPQRYRESLYEELEGISAMEPAEAIRHLCGFSGVGKDSAEKFYAGIEGMMARVSDPSAEVQVRDRVLKILVSEENGGLVARLRERAALTDEPVTTDIKRLIRAPGSLHGGSGFRVTELNGIADLESFDPFVDAVVFGDREISVDARIPLSMPFSGSDYEIRKGSNRVPEGLAVFLCCRGLADIEVKS